LNTAHTLTGSFPVGFRRLGSSWQKDLGRVIEFAKSNGFSHIDIGPEPADVIRQIISSGLAVGSVDLPRPWEQLASPDAGERAATADKWAEHVKSSVAVGANIFFVAVFPDDPKRKRSESFALAADGFSQLCERIAPLGAKIVIEGYPGSAPYFSSLVCTPAAYRDFFNAVGSPAIGVNYDPSHLVRLGIDPLRFATEFADRIFHVHAKDTAILPDGLYEHGNLQPAVHAPPHAFGGWSWRYTLPGHGTTPWPAILRTLQSANYPGRVSIELEDEEFSGSAEAEARGLVVSSDFLKKA
jgi:sugar phosphate isomerase/epimerase